MTERWICRHDLTVMAMRVRCVLIMYCHLYIAAPYLSDHMVFGDAAAPLSAYDILLDPACGGLPLPPISDQVVMPHSPSPFSTRTSNSASKISIHRGISCELSSEISSFKSLQDAFDDVGTIVSIGRLFYHPRRSRLTGRSRPFDEPSHDVGSQR